MKNIISILLIIASAGIILGFIKPNYGEMQTLQKEDQKYNDALSQASVLKQSIVDHETTIKNFNPDDLARLNKMLPNDIDNVKLIIDVNNIASNFGLSIKNIAIASKTEGNSILPVSEAQAVANSKMNYKSIDLSFVVTSSYPNFLQFLKSLEASLRLVDVTAITFVPSDKNDVYDFSITLRTYWLN